MTPALTATLSPLTLWKSDLSLPWTDLWHRCRLWGGSPGTCPQIIEKRPCIYHFLPPFAPPIFWFAHPIFLTSLRQCPLDDPFDSSQRSWCTWLLSGALDVPRLRL